MLACWEHTMTEAKNRLLTIGAFMKKKKSRRAVIQLGGDLFSLMLALSLSTDAAATNVAAQRATSAAAKKMKGYPHLLFVGDSLTEGYGVANNEAYPYLVAEKLKAAGFTRLTFTNSGASGATSSFGPKMVTFQLKKRRPDYVIYALGSNDGLRGIDPKATRQRITEALDILHKAKVPVLLTGQRAAPNYGPVYTKAFDGLFPAIAKERGIAFLPFLL